MRFIPGFIFGFVAGAFFALYQTVEAPDGLAVKAMQGIKALLEVL
jgi:hypothetical protein